MFEAAALGCPTLCLLAPAGAFRLPAGWDEWGRAPYRALGAVVPRADLGRWLRHAGGSTPRPPGADTARALIGDPTRAAERVLELCRQVRETVCAA